MRQIWREEVSAETELKRENNQEKGGQRAPLLFYSCPR